MYLLGHRLQCALILVVTSMSLIIVACSVCVQWLLCTGHLTWSRLVLYIGSGLVEVKACRLSCIGSRSYMYTLSTIVYPPSQIVLYITMLHWAENDYLQGINIHAEHIMS